MGERILQIESVDSLGGTKKHEAFLRDSKTGILLAHAGYTLSGKRNEWYEKVAYLNTLSSLSGAMKGRVRTILGGKEADRYNPEVLPEDLVCNIGRPGMELVRRLVSEILPNDIIFLRIPVAEKVEQKLNRYYWQVGGELKSNDMIRAVSNYSDGVCYQIRPI